MPEQGKQQHNDGERGGDEKDGAHLGRGGINVIGAYTKHELWHEAAAREQQLASPDDKLPVGRMGRETFCGEAKPVGELLPREYTAEQHHRAAAEAQTQGARAAYTALAAHTTLAARMAVSGRTGLAGNESVCMECKHEQEHQVYQDAHHRQCRANSTVALSAHARVAHICNVEGDSP